MSEDENGNMIGVPVTTGRVDGLVAILIRVPLDIVAGAKH